MAIKKDLGSVCVHFESSSIAFRLFIQFSFHCIIGIVEIESDDQNAVGPKNTEVLDFMVSNAKNARDACIDCRKRFKQNELRIMRVVHESTSDKNQNDELKTGQAQWYHVACFVRQRSAIGWLQSADSLPGFKRLSARDKEIIQEQIP